MILALASANVLSIAVVAVLATRLHTLAFERDLAQSASEARFRASCALEATLKRLWRSHRAVVSDERVPAWLRKLISNQAIAS